VGVLSIVGSKVESAAPRKYGNVRSTLDFGSEIWKGASS
jgi:hypothetical protein